MEHKKGKISVFFCRFCMFVCCLLAGGVVYLGCVLLGSGEEMVAAQEETVFKAVARLQAGDFTDLTLLKQSFDASVPYWENVSLSGKTRNFEQHGETVRYMEVCFDNGCRVRAVTPQRAAALIWEKKGSSLGAQSGLNVLGAPVLTVSRDGGYEFGFVLEDTYYAVLVPNADAKQAADILTQMIWMY